MLTMKKSNKIKANRMCKNRQRPCKNLRIDHKTMMK